MNTEKEESPLVTEFVRLKVKKSNERNLRSGLTKEKNPVNCYAFDYLRILSRICDILHYAKTKKEILETLAYSSEAISASSLEKCLCVLRKFFDAPIIFDMKKKTYSLRNYDFKKTLTDIL